MANGHGGARPNGGRRPKLVEMQVSRVADSKLPTIILKSAKALNAFFDYRPKPEERFEYLKAKADLAAKFMVRAMPQRFEGEVKAQVVAMGMVTINGQALGSIFGN